MPQARPNIVLMISHDLGCHIGPYGFAIDQTPRLNAFADQAIRLDRHFCSSPGCSQSRSSLITGRYPHSNGQFGLAHLGWDLNRDQVLLPQALHGAGYHTTMFGIWHLHEWTLEHFDSLSDDLSVRDSSPEGYGEIASARAEQWLSDWAANPDSGEKPFYLHVGFWEVHRPFCGHIAADSNFATGPAIDPAEVPVPTYLPNNEATRGEFAELHRSVNVVDSAVGRVLDALKQNGLAQNTLVIFTADHGLPFPRAKGTLYDPGIQVAFLARLPGRIEAGEQGEAAQRNSGGSKLTSNVDLMPTLLEAAGIDIPQSVQGRSFLDLLTGQPDASRSRDAIFAEKTYHEHYDPMRCVRGENHKYIRNFADRPALVLPSDIYNSPTRQSMTDDERLWSHRPAEEFYDLVHDPAEEVNLIDDPNFSQKRDAMRGQLDDWMKRTEDPLLDGPIPRPAGVGMRVLSPPNTC